MTRHTLSILVDNEAGVLSQVTRLFSRKGYNIESLAVGVTEDHSISRITVEVLADDRHVDLLCNQLQKLLCVHKVVQLNNALRRELVMVKVANQEIGKVIEKFDGKIIDKSDKCCIIEFVGDDACVEEVEKMLSPFGIVELVRTGMIALERDGGNNG